MASCTLPQSVPLHVCDLGQTAPSCTWHRHLCALMWIHTVAKPFHHHCRHLLHSITLILLAPAPHGRHPTHYHHRRVFSFSCNVLTAAAIVALYFHYTAPPQTPPDKHQHTPLAPHTSAQPHTHQHSLPQKHSPNHTASQLCVDWILGGPFGAGWCGVIWL